MKAFFAALLIVLAVHAEAAMPAQVKRGDLEIKITVTGTVVPAGIFRIKSAIEGRVESVRISTFAWIGADEPLAFTAHKELAAMLDSRGTQDVGILEDRWQKVFKPTISRCPGTCFILKNFLKPKSWIKPGAVMFEAASALQLVGRVRPEDMPWIHDGQELIFWPLNNPQRILKGRVTRLLLDVESADAAPGGAFTLMLSPNRYLDPGTKWEGRIIPLVKKGVLSVPTAALIGDAGGVYLPVRVSTGITTMGMTEISAGVEEKRDILILDDAQLLGAHRYQQEAGLQARPRRALKAQGESATAPGLDIKPVKHATVIEGADYSEDPYAEPP